jgi:hypothetical protein
MHRRMQRFHAPVEQLAHARKNADRLGWHLGGAQHAQGLTSGKDTHTQAMQRTAKLRDATLIRHTKNGLHRTVYSLLYHSITGEG